MASAPRPAADWADRHPAVAPSPAARALAAGVVSRYGDAAIALLADLVAFRTVAAPPVPNVDQPEFHRLKAYLAGRAGELGLDYADHGAAVVIGLGSGPDRVGLLTHADVQPADPVRWGGDPFRLDAVTEPGRLVGRGVEDDKASIATALYAMRALADDRPRRRRVELIVSMTEESDWTPFREFLRGWRPPPLNIALDGEYPVVTAEKGSGSVRLTLPPEPGSEDADGGSEPYIAGLRGGAFRTQIPGEAEAVIERAGAELAAALRAEIDPAWEVGFELDADGRDDRNGARLRVRAQGVAAHSSMPEDGRNAITHLAALLGSRAWPPTPAARMVGLINDLVGTGHHAEHFGELAHSHDFMGPLTLALTTLNRGPDGSLIAGLNVRRPVGRGRADVEAAIRRALEGWRARNAGARLEAKIEIGEPYYVASAPHVPVLLGVFRHFTGDRSARPIAVGGGTQARLLPNGVNFGPSMPGAVYTGHSDHEFMTVEQFRLNLAMCTAALAELARP